MKLPSVHEDGLDVVVLVREPTGSWRRHEPAPRFHTAKDARKWLSSQGMVQLAGRQVVLARILDMVRVEVVNRSHVRLTRPPHVEAKLSAPASAETPENSDE